MIEASRMKRRLERLAPPILAWIVCFVLVAGTAAAEDATPKDALEQARMQASEAADGSTHENVKDAEQLGLARDDIREAVMRFTQRVGEYQSDIGAMVDDQFRRKEKEIDKKYDAKLKALEEKDLIAIEKAIKRLKAFIARYGHERKYTPDAKFRLAELYYQKAKKDFQKVREQKLAEYEKALAMFDEGLLEVEPRPPHPDFGEPVRLYEEIIAEFPQYRYIDAVYYILAYCYQETGDLPRVRYALTSLVRDRPDSPYVAEAYLRIGDAYFNEMNYQDALQALLQAEKFKDSPFYDQILYKLASTYFILNRFQDSVRVFAMVNDYSEKKKTEKGEHSYFRDEAVKYIAFCYAQDVGYWANAGVENAVAWFEANPGRIWEPDVFRELGDYFVKQNSWEPAVVSYRRVLKLDPWNPENPELQNKIINIYISGIRDEQQQNIERERLINDYGMDSEWALKNADNPEAVKIATDLALNSLKQWATYQHIQAQKYKQLERDAEAKEYYLKAAAAYRKFLDTFPHDKEAYELHYLMADALFFSGDYAAAAPEFIKVRDDRGNKKYFIASARGAVICYDNLVSKKGEGLIQTEEEAQQQQEDRLKAKGEIKAETIPELKQKYIDVADFYVLHAKQAPERDKIAWNTAEIFFEYNHLDKARERYIDLVNNFPKSELAPPAAKRIIDTYTLVEDWVKVTEWSEKLASLELGDEETRKTMQAEMKMIKGNAMALYAKELEERKEFEKAARQYLKAIAEDPKGKDAPAMLYNAAFNYSKAERPAKAMDLYQRMVDDYPESEFASDALYNVADNAFRAFNLEHASKSFENLYTKYKDIEPKRKCLAIYNHAQLKEFNHEYRQAARIYEKYSRECSEVEADAPLILFRAGELFEKLEDWNNMNRVYEDFIKRFGKMKANHRFVVQAYFKIGEAYKGRKKMKQAFQYYNKALDFFDANPHIHADFLANQLAAKAKFAFVDIEFNKYVRMKIAGRNEKLMAESFKKKQEKMAEIGQLMATVRKYKSPEYWLASNYRAAHAVEIFADALFDAPVPRELKKLGEEYVLEYQQILSDQARPIYQKAAQAYLEALEFAKIQKLFASPWMKRVFQALNRPNIQSQIGAEMKMRKPEKYEFIDDAILPPRMDTGVAHVPVKPEEQAPATDEGETPAEGEAPEGETAPEGEQTEAPTEPAAG